MNARRFLFALGVAWQRMGDAGRVTLFLIGLGTVIGAASWAMVNRAAHLEREAAAAAEKKKADRRTEVASYWSSHKDQVKADLDRAIREGQLGIAQQFLNTFSVVAAGELAPFEQRMKVAKQLEFIAALRPDQAIARTVALRELVAMDPANPQWKRDLSKAERAEVVYRRELAAAEKRAKLADLAARRSQGVHSGMTKQDVLLSSWGRPERVNETIRGQHVHEQWVYSSGNYLYFEDGILTTIQRSR